jgi:hypothetical protein
MIRSAIAALVLLTPAASSDDPTWAVRFGGPHDELASAVACRRVAERSLECVDLERFSRALESAIRQEIALEQRRAARRFPGHKL